MRQQQLEQEVATLAEENGRLRAEIDNLQSPRTIVDILGIETFDHMMELYPSFREDGRPTAPLTPASEVIWSAVRRLRHVEQVLQDVKDSAKENYMRYADTHARLERATTALAEFAMRSIEEDNQ